MVRHYFPQIFDVPDLKHAKKVILTNEGPGADTDSRWALETPYVMELIRNAFDLRSDMVVLDYGCGIGRMAKPMIEACGCSVVGVDISPSMRKLAIDYVGSDRFIAVSPDQFDRMVGNGLRVHAAIAVWVLQHCYRPADDIGRIRRSLAAEGSVFVVNMPKRAIPAISQPTSKNVAFGWATDNIDVALLLRSAFHVASSGDLDKSRVPNFADVSAYYMNLRNPAN